MTNKSPSVESIINTIILSDSARTQIQRFTKKLDDQGVLDLFFKKEKLDVLTTTFRDKGILSGEFAWIDFSSEYLLRDVTTSITKNLAVLLYEAGIHTPEAINQKIKTIISNMEKPESAVKLYFWLLQFASDITDVFILALSEYYAKHPEEETNYMPVVVDAIPAPCVSNADCKYWALIHSRLFNKIYWEESFTKMPFELCYESTFNGAQTTPGGSTKEEIKNDVYYDFKLLIIDEVFKKLTKSRDRTAKNIAIQAYCLYWDRKIFVHMLFVKAFLGIALDDKERLKFMDNENTIPVSHNTGFGNLPS